jgi:tetratricopeptide (TPR) repeat protein
LARQDLAISLDNLGNIRLARGDLDGAENYFARSRKILEVLANETHTVEARRNLSVSLEKLGDIRLNQRNLDGAEDYFARSLEIAEALANETHTVESYDDLAVSYFKLATLREPYNRELLKKALDIFSVLAENCPGMARYRKIRDSLQDLLNSMN